MRPTQRMNDAPRAQVLVATDASEHADEALRRADRWARAGGLRLMVIHVLQVQPPITVLFPSTVGDQVAGYEDLRAQVTSVIRQKVEAITGRGPDDYALTVATGTPYVEIVRAAETEPTALIVLGARGHTGLMRVFLGHTAEKVARHAHCPVFVARPGPRTGRVLVATDLSAASAAAIRGAAAYARTHEAALSAVYVVDTAMPFPLDMGSGIDTSLSMRESIKNRGMTQLEAQLSELGIAATPIIAESPIGDAVADAAEALNAELVVVGTHGRTGLRRIALGNTAGEVLESVHCSVLVIRTEDPKKS